ELGLDRREGDRECLDSGAAERTAARGLGGFGVPDRIRVVFLPLSGFPLWLVARPVALTDDLDPVRGVRLAPADRRQWGRLAVPVDDGLVDVCGPFRRGEVAAALRKVARFSPQPNGVILVAIRSRFVRQSAKLFDVRQRK